MKNEAPGIQDSDLQISPQLASLEQAESICKSPECQGLFFYEKCEYFSTPDYRSHKVGISRCTNKGF